jgi:hypothetical protein
MAARSTLTVTSGTTITSAWGNSVRDHAVPYTTSNDVTTEGMLAVNTSTDQLVIHNGSAAVQFGTYGTPTTWTGTPTQTGYAGTWSSTDCFYTRFGRLIVGVGQIDILTGTGTAGNGISLATNLPVPANTLQSVGAFRYHDSGSTYYAGTITLNTSGGFGFAVSGNASGFGVSPSVGLASGDQFFVQFSYFAASAT